jgi:hypothetical protein
MIMSLLSLGLVFKIFRLHRFLKTRRNTVFSMTERKMCLKFIGVHERTHTHLYVFAVSLPCNCL